MQQVRIWEITADRTLSEIPARYADLEQWIEDWLADDISVLDPSLLVIGRQVRTSFGGAVDLLCMDGDGNLVVVELKRGQTPRDVAAQALEYSSWVDGWPVWLWNGRQRRHTKAKPTALAMRRSR